MGVLQHLYDQNQQLKFHLNDPDIFFDLSKPDKFLFGKSIWDGSPLITIF